MIPVCARKQEKFSAKGGAALGERKYCYRCMEKYDGLLHVCPNCGYEENTPHNPMYITPGTVLHDRYLIGILLEFNGEGATYVGLDISTGCRVLLREYMPVNLCTRVKGKAIISVNYNNLAKYKAFMAEYTELNKSLARLRNDSNINPVLDMFAENNTTYTVFEYINGVKMLDYLKENAGELSWEQVSKIFPPLFTTIGRLHNAGIIHRAVSPDTVYITEKGELRLSGFCVSAVRTANAGIEYELFKGYAAPEQYSASSSSRQGSWTDVYGICALLYRALTGCMPVDSVSRLKHDDLCEPCMLNANIPQHVSRVIMEGMNLSGRDRIQTITELVTRLFEQPAVIKSAAPAPPVDSYGGNHYREQNDPGYPQQPVQQPYPPADYPPPQNYGYNDPRGYYDNRDEERYRYEKVNTVDRIKVPIIIGILLLAILMIILGVIINILRDPNSGTPSSSDLTSGTNNVVSGTSDTTTEETAPKDTEVPDLVGKFYTPTKEKWKEFLTLDPSYEFSDEYDNDMIIKQSVEKGEMVSKGSVIKVTVSKGKESAIIPDFSGQTTEQYKIRLEQAGFTEANYQFVESQSYQYGSPDSVIGLEIDGKSVSPGTSYSKKDSKRLVVYYIRKDAVQPTTAPPVVTEVTEPPIVTTTEAPPVVTEAPPQPTEQPPEPPQPTEAPPEVPPEYGQW